METVGQNGETHQEFERLGNFHAESRQAGQYRGSRTTGQHVLSSGESEIMSKSELLKEAKLTQYNLEFCGMGHRPIVLHTVAGVARAFCHERVERMKHLDVGHCWLQEELQSGNCSVKRVESSTQLTCLLTVPLQKNCESSFP